MSTTESTTQNGTGRTLAVFGAGPGLGMSLARRFGRAGYTVALVARSTERLASFAADLAAEDITAHTVTADLGDVDGLGAVVDRVTEVAGPIDVAAVNPVGRTELIARTLDVDATNLAKALVPLLYGPVELLRALYPDMVERGSGAIVVAGGTTAIRPVPLLGSVGVGGAAIRNHVLALNATLATTGVYVGIVPIGGLIERSDTHRLMTENPEVLSSILSSGEDAPPPIPLDVLDPDSIADLYWDLVTRRDRAEEVVGSGV